MSDIPDRAAAACLALLEATTQHRPHSQTATDVKARVYVDRLRHYPPEVLRVLADRWTDTEAGQYFPTLRELTVLADRVSSEQAARSASAARRIGGGVSLQPEGPVAAFVDDCRVRLGDGWVASWLGQPDRAGEHTPAPWVRFSPREIHTTAFGAARIREKAHDLLARHGVRVVESQAAADMAAEWAARTREQEQEAFVRRRAGRSS